MQQPLSYRLRPETIDEFIGLENLLSCNTFLKNCVKNNCLFSMIFYGAPGSGKTTLAIVLANEVNERYRILNATTNNKKDLDIVFEEAKMYGHLIVIIDEIHRLNKDKQDLLLSYVENGLITLIGMTTANPYHSINPAIRSRCHLIEFKITDSTVVRKVLDNALISPKGLNNKYTIDNEVLDKIVKLSNGDIRYALNALEMLSLSSNNTHISINDLKENIRVPQYLIDKDEDGHYNAVSALQKSIRGSDVNAALYYLARLIEANDLDSIERRLPIIAYEDIGLANPQAVSRTYEAIETAKKVGFPEAMIPLGFAVVDLALSPKSKNAYLGINRAIEEVSSYPLPIPKYLEYTPVGLKEEDKYPYDRPDLWEKIQYLPEQIKNKVFFDGEPHSNYEKALFENYKRLKGIKRSSKISSLK